MLRYKIHVIPLWNEEEQQFILPRETKILCIREHIAVPTLHVLMRSDQSESDQYTLVLLNTMHEPRDLSNFEYLGEYVRDFDQQILHAFYKKEELQ